jgi:hypothetical protein
MSSISNQTVNFQNNSDPNHGVSIVIPRMFNNLNWRRVKQLFVQANFGFVERVDVVAKGDHKTAYVHFAPGKWNMRSHEARHFLTKLQNGEEVQLVYDDPWYWKIRISNSVRPSEGPKQRVGRKKTLDLSEKDGVAVFRPIKVAKPTRTDSSSPKDEQLLRRKNRPSQLNLEEVNFEVENDPIQARMAEHNRNHELAPPKIKRQVAQHSSVLEE